MSVHDPAPNCTMDGPRCEWWPRCQGCGFDRIEDGRRKCILHFQGLTKGKDGLLTLMIGKKGKHENR